MDAGVLDLCVCLGPNRKHTEVLEEMAKLCCAEEPPRNFKHGMTDESLESSGFLALSQLTQ